MGRHPQHSRAARGGGAGGHDPRRRRDLSRDAPRHRVRAGRVDPREGQGRAGRGVAADRPAGAPWPGARRGRPPAAGQPPRGARPVARAPRRRSQQPRAAARDDRRRAGDREEPARLRALPAHRGAGRPHQLPPGSLAPVSRGRLVLGPRRDRQGPSRHARDRRGGGGREQAPCGRARPRPEHCRGEPNREPPALARRDRRRRDHRRRSARGGVRRVAAFPRGDRSAAPARPRLRGRPLGRRRAPRLHRAPRRVGP